VTPPGFWKNRHAIRPMPTAPISAPSPMLEPESFAAQLDRTRMSARQARSNLEPAVALALLIILDAVLANSHRFIHAAMPVEAGLVEIP
jgi:hypothetical protein